MLLGSSGIACIHDISKFVVQLFVLRCTSSSLALPCSCTHCSDLCPCPVYSCGRKMRCLGCCGVWLVVLSWLYV